MTPQAAAAWAQFFATAAGAAATLVGLVIVAISVNLQRIISFRHLPSRAFAAIGSLMLIMISSLATLMPQPRTALALEILLFSVGTWARHLWAARQAQTSRAEYSRPLWEIAFGITSGQVQTLPFLIGSLVLLGSSDGFYWIAGGILAAFILSVMEGWIFLVEIMR